MFLEWLFYTDFTVLIFNPKDLSIISEKQIGFKRNSRTSDHILTLKSIIDFQKSKKEKVFAAFIDLRNAFDTVWRDGLF